MSKPSREFWRDRRVVVTGGTGFLGTVVCRKLRERGCKQVQVPDHGEFDLTEKEAVKRMYAAMRPEMVIHLAAEVGGIGANLAHPGEFFYTNMMMGLNVIEQGRLHGVRKLVQVGTVCAYPKFAPVPFREDDLWNGYPEETNAPYGIAKKTLLVMCQAYRQQYGFNGIYLLPVNLYGPGDNFDPDTGHVIPALIHACVDAVESGSNKITCWGSGKVSREFLYVDDAAEGILLAAEFYDDPEPVNLGSGNEIVIQDLAEKIARMCGYQGAIEWDESQPDGQPRRQLDISRARERFGFVAQMDFDQGLTQTIQWYRRNSDKQTAGVQENPEG